jgi:hypothetical protein
MLVLTSTQLLFATTGAECEGEHYWPKLTGDHARWVKCKNCDVWGYFDTPEKRTNARNNVGIQEGMFDADS